MQRSLAASPGPTRPAVHRPPREAVGMFDAMVAWLITRYGGAATRDEMWLIVRSAGLKWEDVEEAVQRGLLCA